LGKAVSATHRDGAFKDDTVRRVAEFTVPAINQLNDDFVVTRGLA
jgi:hypothetical protein